MTVERTARTGFAAAVVVLVAVGCFTYYATTGLIDSDARVSHTRDVLADLHAVLASMTEAESVQRGYIITGDASYLQPYGGATATARRKLDDVRALTRDDRDQRRRLDGLATLVEQRLRVLQGRIDLRRDDGFEAARASLMAGAGAELMGQIRSVIGEAAAEEDQVLGRRIERARRSEREMLLAFAAGALLQAGLLAAVYRLLARDAAARRRAAAAQAALVTRLEQSNRELQDFASVASHDLQEPLRKIQAFGDRLRGRCDGALGDAGRDYLARMQNAAARMQTLIDDLLTFSRVTTRALPFQPVDLSAVTREVVSDLEARIEQSGGRVEVGDLPAVEADPLQMRQLMQNLIGNALKFSRPGEPPLVRVSRAAGPDAGAIGPKGANDAGAGGNGSARGTTPPPDVGYCEFTVRDNGIGFDMKYLDRIFTVFQRLHGRGEYEGTGVGLAVCRKIVERHGGTITARSALGQGAAFLVRLPARQRVPLHPDPAGPLGAGQPNGQASGRPHAQPGGPEGE